MAKPTIAEETLAYSNPVDGTGPLNLFVAYPCVERALPLLVVMHGYSRGADRTTVAGVVRRFAREHGVMAAGLDLRGRPGSAGRRDSGGREVSDIHAACKFLVAHFGRRLDPEDLGILGYSGGGGNVFSSLVKCPDLFRSAFSFFGISDYAYWFDHGAEGRHRAQLVEDVGGHPGEVPERYAARNSLLGVRNNRQTDIHLFWDAEEVVCPAYFNRAYAERSRLLGQSRSTGSRPRATSRGNVTLHESRPGDRRRWHHGYPANNSDLVTLEPFIAGCLHRPHVPPVVLDPVGEMTVVGYLITKAFCITLGDLTDSVADLQYSVAGRAWRFSLLTQSAPPGTRATLALNPYGLRGRWPFEGVQGRSRVTVRRLDRGREEPWPQVRLTDNGVLIEDVPLSAEVVVTPR